MARVVQSGRSREPYWRLVLTATDSACRPDFDIHLVGLNEQAILDWWSSFGLVSGGMKLPQCQSRACLDPEQPASINELPSCLVRGQGEQLGAHHPGGGTKVMLRPYDHPIDC
jgi:hypothetical protein